jgi:hypothetical protein
MSPDEVDLLVWRAVRLGGRHGARFGLLRDAVLVRCGVALGVDEVNGSFERLVSGGHVYVSGKRHRQHVLAGPSPAAAGPGQPELTQAEPEPLLWEIADPHREGQG